MKIYVLLECWYEGDSYLIDDSFIAASKNIQTLIDKAYKLAEEKYKEIEANGFTIRKYMPHQQEINSTPSIYYPGESVVDDGHFEDLRTRYRIIETKLL